jgi:hypothetical protein
LIPLGRAAHTAGYMATGKKDGDRVAKLKAAIEKIQQETWKTSQTLPKLRHSIALILQELKKGEETNEG